jgi:predicted AAA+ superfamily ATPase
VALYIGFTGSRRAEYSIPSQLAKENKKFQISKVTSGARLKDYEGCIEWLCDAGVINLCYCLHTPELPLKGNNEENKFKIYTADTGMLIAMLDDEAQEDLRANRNMNVYKGGLYENIVAEALVKSGYDLHYYKKENSTLEEDFFVRTKKCLVPVEVKSTNGRSKSLRTLIDSEKYPEIQWGIKLVKGNIGFMNNIYTFPYYCSFLLKRYLMQKDTEK